MINLTEADFEKEVLNSTGVVLVDFWAPWCGPCRMVAPILEDLSVQFNGSVKFVKVNVDENPNLAAKFNVMSIPTMIIFKDGKVVDQLVGSMPKPAIATRLERWTN